ncbi:hypothetical protein ACA910_006947 [Epithemia clementina (nom. ined.)]
MSTGIETNVDAKTPRHHETSSPMDPEVHAVMEELAEHPTLGIVRLDYDYPAAVGDVDNPETYRYPVIYRAVPGLTFQMAQSGKLTSEVAAEFDDAIRWLDKEAGVSAITGDCGFMFWFQDRARMMTSVPVFLSALQQLPAITSALDRAKEQVIVLAANVKSLGPMQNLIESMIGGMVEQDMHYIYVGCEDVEHFGPEVEQGLKVDTEKAEAGILRRCEEALQMYPRARAFLFECTELPPYSDAVRATTGLPVFDAITNCDFVMTSFFDNERFGRQSWYKPWDGKQASYFLDST